MRKKIKKNLPVFLALSHSPHHPQFKGRRQSGIRCFQGRSVGGHREWQLLSHRGRWCLPHQPLTLAPRYTSTQPLPTNPMTIPKLMIFNLNFVKLKIHPMRWLWLKSSRDSWTNLPIWVGNPLLNSLEIHSEIVWSSLYILKLTCSICSWTGQDTQGSSGTHALKVYHIPPRSWLFAKHKLQQRNQPSKFLGDLPN